MLLKVRIVEVNTGKNSNENANQGKQRSRM